MEIVKEMASNPRRISAIRIDVRFPTDFNTEDRASIQRIAMSCPVLVSLHPDVEKHVRFYFPDGSVLG
jgi:hypothetical protein